MTILAAGIAMKDGGRATRYPCCREVLLTVGLAGLLFIGYLIWGTGLRAASAQQALAGALNQ